MMSTEQVRVGDRIRLVRCTDEWTRLRPGALGTVRRVDDFGTATVHVNWDDGSRLGLVPDEDEWLVLDG